MAATKITSCLHGTLGWPPALHAQLYRDFPPVSCGQDEVLGLPEQNGGDSGHDYTMVHVLVCSGCYDKTPYELGWGGQKHLVQNST